jgi:limonene-1,2-epoxide hydrolase
MRWSVRNQLDADGLPVEDWAAAADALLSAQTAVHSATVLATYAEDEIALGGARVAGLSVAVVVEADDADSAAALVERMVVAALYDVVDDRDVGWTAYDWYAAPVQSPR